MSRAKASHCLRRISLGEPRAPLPPAVFGMRLVGRATPCAPVIAFGRSAGRGLTRPTSSQRDNPAIARRAEPRPGHVPGVLAHGHESRRDGRTNVTIFPPCPSISSGKPLSSLRDLYYFHNQPGIEMPGYCHHATLRRPNARCPQSSIPKGIPEKSDDNSELRSRSIVRVP